MHFTIAVTRAVRWASFAFAVLFVLLLLAPVALTSAAEHAPAPSAAAASASASSDSTGGGVNPSASASASASIGESASTPENSGAASLSGLPVPAFANISPAPLATTVIDWRDMLTVTIFAKGVADKPDTPLFPANNPPATGLPLALDDVESLMVTFEFALANTADSEFMAGVATAYTLDFSKELVKLDIPSSSVFTNNLGVPIFHYTLAKNAAGTPQLVVYMDEKAKGLSEIKGSFHAALALDKSKAGNPSDPPSVPLIGFRDGTTVTVNPYTLNAGKPSIQKAAGDVSNVATAPHAIAWSAKLRTGRNAPEDATLPAYTPRPITIVDKVDAATHFFNSDPAVLSLQWTDMSVANPVAVAVPAQTGPSDTTLPRYEVSTDDSTLTVHLPDVPDNTDTNKEHVLRYNTCVPPAYFFANQDKTLKNDITLTADTGNNKKEAISNAVAQLPLWMLKDNTSDMIDPGVGKKMAIAWKVRVNPNKQNVTIPAGAKLIDTLPKGLDSIYSVRTAVLNADNKTYTYTDSYVPSAPLTTNWSLTANNIDTTASGKLDFEKDVSGTLTYTYPSAATLTGEQIFVITALVDVSGLGVDGVEIVDTFLNSATLEMDPANHSGNGYAAKAPPASVTIDYSILSKTGSNINAADRTITWTIHTNKVTLDITNPVLKDTLGTGLGGAVQTYVDGSFEVKDSSDALYTAGTLIVAPDKLSWEYNFNQPTLKDSYTITYKTYMPHQTAYPVAPVSGKVPNEQAPNEVVLEESGVPLISSKATPKWNSVLMTKRIVSYSPTPDATGRRSIVWKIEANSEGAFLKEPVFYDELPTQLAYKPGSFTVMRNGVAGPAPAPELAGFSYNAAARKLEYDFSAYRKLASAAGAAYYPDLTATGIDGKFELTYETYVDEALWEAAKTNGSASDFNNKSALNFDKTLVVSSASANIKKPAVSKSGSDKLLYDNVAKVSYYEWVIEFNRNGAKIDNLTLTDVGSIIGLN